MTKNIDFQVLGWIWEYGVKHDLSDICELIEKDKNFESIIKNIYKPCKPLKYVRKCQKLTVLLESKDQQNEAVSTLCDDLLSTIEEVSTQNLCNPDSNNDFQKTVIELYFNAKTYIIAVKDASSDVLREQLLKDDLSIAWRNFKKKFYFCSNSCKGIFSEKLNSLNKTFESRPLPSPLKIERIKDTAKTSLIRCFKSLLEALKHQLQPTALEKLQSYDTRSHISRQHNHVYEKLLQYTKGGITPQCLKVLIKYLQADYKIKKERCLLSMSNKMMPTNEIIDLEKTNGEADNIQIISSNMDSSSASTSEESTFILSGRVKRKLDDISSDGKDSTQKSKSFKKTKDEDDSLVCSEILMEEDKSYSDKYGRYGSVFSAAKNTTKEASDELVNSEQQDCIHYEDDDTEILYENEICYLDGEPVFCANSSQPCKIVSVIPNKQNCCKSTKTSIALSDASQTRDNISDSNLTQSSEDKSVSSSEELVCINGETYLIKPSNPKKKLYVRVKEVRNVDKDKASAPDVNVLDPSTCNNHDSSEIGECCKSNLEDITKIISRLKNLLSNLEDKSNKIKTDCLSNNCKHKKELINRENNVNNRMSVIQSNNSDGSDDPKVDVVVIEEPKEDDTMAEGRASASPANNKCTKLQKKVDSPQNNIIKKVSSSVVSSRKETVRAVSRIESTSSNNSEICVVDTDEESVSIVTQPPRKSPRKSSGQTTELKSPSVHKNTSPDKNEPECEIITKNKPSLPKSIKRNSPRLHDSIIMLGKPSTSPNRCVIPETQSEEIEVDVDEDLQPSPAKSASRKILQGKDIEREVLASNPYKYEHNLKECSIVLETSNNISRSTFYQTASSDILSPDKSSTSKADSSKRKNENEITMTKFISKRASLRRVTSSGSSDDTSSVILIDDDDLATRIKCTPRSKSRQKNKVKGITSSDEDNDIYHTPPSTP